MSYAIISVGGKQHRVREGEKLLVERLGVAEGKTFQPQVLMLGGDTVDLSPKDGVVTVRVVGHVLGEKIRIGKYRRRTGYRRHNGHRSKLTQIEIESIGAKKRATAAKKDAAAAEEKPKPAAKKPAARAKPKAAAKPKPATEKTEET
jgi:large subunit ribosomal protein L21